MRTYAWSCCLCFTLLTSSKGTIFLPLLCSIMHFWMCAFVWAWWGDLNTGSSGCYLLFAFVPLLLMPLKEVVPIGRSGIIVSCCVYFVSLEHLPWLWGCCLCCSFLMAGRWPSSIGHVAPTPPHPTELTLEVLFWLPTLGLIGCSDCLLGYHTDNKWIRVTI